MCFVLVGVVLRRCVTGRDSFTADRESHLSYICSWFEQLWWTNVPLKYFWFWFDDTLNTLILFKSLHILAVISNFYTFICVSSAESPYRRLVFPSSSSLMDWAAVTVAARIRNCFLNDADQTGSDNRQWNKLIVSGHRKCVSGFFWSIVWTRSM